MGTSGTVGYYARVHAVSLSLGGQVALQLLGTVPELLHHVIVSRAWGVPEVL